MMSSPGLRTGRRRNKILVHHAEDRGVGADAERERDDGDDGEAEILAQDAQAEADVLPEVCTSVEVTRF